MNDRFKYRVWDKRLNRYLGNNDQIQMLLENGNLAYLDDDGMKFYEVEFCTGLKDKNGNLIYEGDILGGVFGLPVIWCDKCKSFELGYPTEEGLECMSCNGDVLWRDVVSCDGDVEILGNVHNKELVDEMFSEF